MDKIYHVEKKIINYNYFDLFTKNKNLIYLGVFLTHDK